MKKIVFLIASITLLIAILKMTYSYYQLLKWGICAVGIYGAYLNYIEKKIAWVWTLGTIALIFNPLVKFYFSKGTWKIIDLVAGVLFFIYFIKQIKVKKK